MQYVIDDEYEFDLDISLKPLPIAEVEVVLPVIAIGRDETPEISEIEFGSVTTHSIDLSFSTSVERAQEAVKGIIYSENADPTFDSDSYKIGYGTGRLDLTIAGLRNGTTYFFKPYALSNLGYKYGNVQSCQTAPSPIPDEYQLVEYLQSTGSQYINTNYIPTAITKWEFDYEFIDAVQSQNGMSNTGASGRFLIANIGDLYVALGDGIHTGMQVTSIRHLFELNASTSSYSVDSETNSLTNTFTGGTTSLYLFGRNAGGSIQQYSVGKLYRSTLSEGDEIKRNLYPVYRKADNKPGLYDIVNDVFYTNQGSGEFIVGPDKEWDE